MTEEEQRWRDPHPHSPGPSGGSSAAGTPAGAPAEAARRRAAALGRGLVSARRVTARGARATARGARVTAHGARVTAHGAGRASRFTFRRAKAASEAQGASESGLDRLIQMHVFNTAGDAAVAISLAGSLFFQVPSGQARTQVALFLGLTMLPFVVVAPLIGPFLDRFAHGRRWAIGGTMGIRAFLAWALATSVTGDSPWVFAGCLGVLVASKSYGVTRAAAVPRLLPSDFTLVRANGRVSLSGIVGATVSAPIAGLASLVGPEWSLRYAFLLYVVAVVCAIRLPPAVDASEGEVQMVLSGPAGHSTSTGGRARTRITPRVAFALRANCGPWWLSGFLLMYLAFLLRDPDLRPDSSLGPQVVVGLVVGAVGLGRTLGTVTATWFHRLTPAVTVVIALLADAGVAVVAFLFFGVWALALLGLVAGLAQALAKFALDATIQRDVPSEVQASAFGRSDTTCQLAWVIGGFVGIALPLDPPRLGLAVSAAALAAWAVYVLSGAPRARIRAARQSASRPAPRRPAGV